MPPGPDAPERDVDVPGHHAPRLDAVEQLLVAARRARERRSPCPSAARRGRTACRRSPSTPGGVLSSVDQLVAEQLGGARRDLVDRRRGVVPVHEPAVGVAADPGGVLQLLQALDRLLAARRRRSRSRRRARTRRHRSHPPGPPPERAGCRGCRTGAQATICTLSPRTFRPSPEPEGLMREDSIPREASEPMREQDDTTPARAGERASVTRTSPRGARPRRAATRRYTAPTWSAAPSGWRCCSATSRGGSSSRRPSP